MTRSRKHLFRNCAAVSVIRPPCGLNWCCCLALSIGSMSCCLSKNFMCVFVMRLGLAWWRLRGLRFVRNLLTWLNRLLVLRLKRLEETRGNCKKLYPDIFFFRGAYKLMWCVFGRFADPAFLLVRCRQIWPKLLPIRLEIFLNVFLVPVFVGVGVGRFSQFWSFLLLFFSIFHDFFSW